MAETTQFDGWAVVELFGHQKIAGHVTTEYFGTACMFRVEVPDLPERAEALKRSEYHPTLGYLLPGTEVVREAEAGYTRLIGPGAVYAINPCTEETVRAGLESSRRKPLRPLNLIPQIAAAEETEESEDDYEARRRMEMGV